MKEVKIYTIVSDQLSPPITGESFCTDMVRHSDYAELEAKCAAMVAENAGMKHAMSVTLEHVSVTDAGQAGVAAMIINDALHHSETPATDAFLAEVRAQGVEMMREHPSIKLCSLTHICDELATQLRKGAAL
ncbi:eae-like protein [Salmonella enterica]|nr:eae-like protein [Salmonella enterica]EDR7170683.1 eae-like protein [Salmonella enterica subsp. houtenae]EJU5349035.1 eae-like protein [Salmonella enterica]